MDIPSQLGKTRILLIEDSPTVVLAITTMLTDSDGYLSFHLETADSLDNGLQMIRNSLGPNGQTDIDLLLLDLNLPDCQGLRTLERVREVAPQLPIIVETSIDDDEGVRQAINEGAQDCLIKGEFDQQLLRRSIRYVLERKRVERFKDEMIGTASHELRTPLTIIKGSLSNLYEGGVAGPLSEGQKRILETVQRSVKRLEQLVNNLLDVARLEMGMKISRDRVVTTSLILDVVKTLQASAAEKKVTLRHRLSPDLPDLIGNKEMVIEVLTNLINNAIRFAQKKVIVGAGPVTDTGALPVEFPGPHVEISVSDDGPGIAQEDLPRLFEKFVQINRPEGGARYKGTGLGLAICRKIVEGHHGKIWVESVLEGGSRFSFVIPQWREEDAA